MIEERQLRLILDPLCRCVLMAESPHAPANMKVVKMKMIATLTALIAATIFSFSPAMADEGQCPLGYYPGNAMANGTQVKFCIPAEMLHSGKIVSPERAAMNHAVNGVKAFGSKQAQLLDQMQVSAMEENFERAQHLFENSPKQAHHDLTTD